MQSLQLSDYADPELLAILKDVADDEGWASSDTVISELRLETPRPRANLGIRLSWMKRWGWVENHPYERGRWRLTGIGHGLLLSKMDRETQTMLRRLSPAERVHVTRILSKQGQESSIALRSMLRREWRRNIG